MFRWTMILALLLAGCGSSASPAVTPGTGFTLQDGDPGPQTLAGGRYTVSWTADCSYFTLEWAPLSGTSVPIFRADKNVEPTASGLPSGSVTVALPAGPGYLNRGGSCSGPYTVTVTPAS